MANLRRSACGVLGILVLAPAGAQEPQESYRIGDKVELHIAGDMWQSCVVTENFPGSVMKGRCEEYVQPGGSYTRAGGIYVLYPGDTRRAKPRPAPAASTSPAPAGRPSTPPLHPGGRSSQGPRGGGGRRVRVPGAGGFAVGQRVEIEASGHWVPCVVAENEPDAIMRVYCENYPALSRDPGLYTVDRDNPEAVRPATGQVGKAPTPPPPPRHVPAPAGLKVGEYGCWGSGGQILAGYAFIVLPGNRYTDAEGGAGGTFRVDGTLVRFKGGFLDGQLGRDLRGHSFTLGSQAECEPY